MVNKIIYEKLKEVAQKGKQNNIDGIIYYEEVMLLAGLDRENPADREIKLRDMLDNINREEHENGIPMITAIVVRKDTKIPGKGFFELAREMDLHKGRDDEKFWINEIRKVWDYWDKAD